MDVREGHAVDQALTEVLAPGFATDLETRSTEELRELRARAEAVEEAVSYARRMLQGRLDILRAELLRREEGGDEAATHLLGSLPGLLGSDGPRSDQLHARATRLRVPPGIESYEAELDAIVTPDQLDAIDGHDEAELAAIVERLSEHERELSGRRRQLFGVIDGIRDELAARYKDGRASVSDFLAEE